MHLELFIGRAANNDIVVDQPIVSKVHAKITYIGEGKIQIEDLGSTNKTFVNGEKIIRKIITQSDRVTLGSFPLDTEGLFKAVMKKVNENKTDFRKEFYLLKTKYEEFEQSVEQLQKGTQTKSMLLKAGITLAAMAFSFFLIKDSNLRYSVMMLAGIVGGFLSLSNRGNSRVKDEVDRLNADLQREYKCPKCGMSLMSRRWSYWARLGSCPQCQAKWVD